MAYKNLTRIFHNHKGYYYKKQKKGDTFVEKHVKPTPEGKVISTILNTDLENVLKEIALSEARKCGSLHSVNAYEAEQVLFHINPERQNTSYHAQSFYATAIKLYKI